MATTISRFAGDFGRIKRGFAVTDNNRSNLQWDDTVQLLGSVSSHIKSRRCFVPGWVGAGLWTWADWCVANKVFGVISVKAPGNDWAGVAAGKYDKDLAAVKAEARSREAASLPPFCLVVHHEPDGDGDLAVWARMQTYLSNYFADASTAMVYGSIGNGFWHGPSNPDETKIAAAYPKSLTDAMIKNRGLFMTDSYDSDRDRTSKKVAAFVSFCRTRGLKAIGHGEFGCYDGADIDACAAVFKANADIYGPIHYFNSGQNSRADWRMIPVGYPADPAVSSYKDLGGNAQSAARLEAGKRWLT